MKKIRKLLVMKYNYFNKLSSSHLLLKFVLLVCLSLFYSCDEKSQTTTLKVKDPQRHYFPISQGEKLHIFYPVTNTGDALLEIKEIQTSCGCVVVDESTTKDISPKKTGYLHFIYDTNKNTGYVQHQIYLYGNFAKQKGVELSFDTHVVPSSLYTKDYEEIYKEIQEEEGDIVDKMKALEKQKNYYTGDSPEES